MLTPSQVRTIIETSADDVYDGELGYYLPRLNAYQALKKTIEEYGGTLGGSGKTVTFHEDITITAGVELTIASGTTVKFDADKKLTVYGKLVADGVTFTSTTSSNWDGIVFDGADNNSAIANSIISNANIGLSIKNTNMTVETNEIYITQSYGIYVYMPNSTSPDLVDNYVHDTGSHGIYLSACDSRLKDNSVVQCNAGLYITNNSNVLMNNYGLNKIIMNSSSSIPAIYILSGTPNMGEYHSKGNNDIRKGSSYAVFSLSGNEILAEKNYWGGSPLSSWFYGNVNYDFPLSSSPANVGSSLGKTGIFPDDRMLLAEGTALLDVKNYGAAASVYKELIEKHPESELVGTALAWAMGALKEAGELESQRDYLKEMIVHHNPLAQEKALLWLQSLESWSGFRNASEEIVNSVSVEKSTGVEIRLNWASDLLNLYNDNNAAQKIFDELLSAKANDKTLVEAFEHIKTVATIFDKRISLPKNLSIDSAKIIKDFTLQNYPNPFNPSTTIQFTLPEKAVATLHIFDVLGRYVRTLVDREMSAGSHSIQWDGRNNLGIDAAAGLYFANLRSGHEFKTIKLLLVR